MEIESVGPWVLLLLGVITCLAAVWIVIRDRSVERLWIMWVFGVAMMGVGVYGPAFLLTYSAAIEQIVEMQTADMDDAVDIYQETFTTIAEGDMPAEYQEIALAYALERPVAGMEGLLAEAVAQAPPQSQQREALEQAAEAFAGKRRAAAELATVVTAGSGDVQIERFDPVSKQLVAAEILARPPRVLREQGVSGEAQATLQVLATERPPVAVTRPAVKQP